MEAEFECLHPGLNLELVEESNAVDDYYASDPDKKRGFVYVEADVYEVDTILLSDFVAAKKLSQIELPFDDFDEGARIAVSRDGKTYGVPHWLCGNFLFYRRGDAEIAEAKSWSEISEILSKRRQGLLVDFKGGLTLGEWYLTALSDAAGLEAAQAAIVRQEQHEKHPEAIASLQKILDLCPIGYCRSEDLHDRSGFYARAFVRGQAAAYVGYSESIYLGLKEAADDCTPTSGCLQEGDIGVRNLPGSSDGLRWVDALAIDAKLNGPKKDLALAFIKYAMQVETYRKLLLPEWPYTSRYLLPARPVEMTGEAPLYVAFSQSIRSRQTGTTAGLNQSLRKLAKTVVDCALPRDRDDENKSCAPMATGAVKH
jgi:thiamine pyridinylase